MGRVTKTPWRARHEAGKIDDIRNDFGSQPVACKDPLQKCRRGDSQRCPGEHAEYVSRRSGKESIGIPSPVVDDHRRAAQTSDDHRRSGKQMPGPAGVGKNMHHARAPSRLPKLQQIRQQTKTGAQHRQMTHPGWSIGRVGAYQFDIQAVSP
ncbi:MAG: hypothetical protein CAPSK01_003831 [Candidatus Accumulibacter vicinus]|uniref:Uncharacterized protein n=1 Tax=Candidatus Accumulibacter vicinus TaxID=2954382 RepID=A0A084XWP8_9PROT|nr:MAG: hypothetical protein CAPSK01_003831 [Candidatus Accumulibacter vicinus]